MQFLKQTTSNYPKGFSPIRVRAVCRIGLTPLILLIFERWPVSFEHERTACMALKVFLSISVYIYVRIQYDAYHYFDVNDCMRFVVIPNLQICLRLGGNAVQGDKQDEGKSWDDSLHRNS